MTAARCEVCNSPMRMKAFLKGTPYENDPAHLVCPATPLDHWRLGYERLKAENASLRESLREKELYAEEVRLRSVDYAQQLKESRAHAVAAEQRAEAAEKERQAARDAAYDLGVREAIQVARAVAAEQRNTELEGALRAALPWVRRCPAVWEDADELGRLEDRIRAALHDEERSAPQQEEK